MYFLEISVYQVRENKTIAILTFRGIDVEFLLFKLNRLKKSATSRPVLHLFFRLPSKAFRVKFKKRAN